MPANQRGEMILHIAMQLISWQHIMDFMYVVSDDLS